jgi:hypothetical protein
MTLKSVLLGAAILTLPGCAGLVSAWKNDPIQSYDVTGPSIYAMTGDRRTAIFTGSPGALKYCAESLPDAVSVFTASSKAGLEADMVEKVTGKATYEDASAAALLQTFQRTEIAELSRQMAFNLCLGWSQGALDAVQYHALLSELVAGSIDVMKLRAAQPIVVVPSASLVLNTPIGAASPTPSPAPSGSATPKPSPSPAPTPSPAATPEPGRAM